MDPSIKKRKSDENGTVVPMSDSSPNLTPEDARKIIEPFTQEQLIEIVQNAAIRHPEVLDAVREIADRDPAQRKLFIRGLGWDTTTEGLRNLFSVYGELEEAVVILDKVTGKSKGFGFITFRHIDGALLALKEPSKKIDGRVAVTNLASQGNPGHAGQTVQTVQAPAAEVPGKKIYVANVPVDMPGDRLLAHFSSYGDIEEGPLGFDKVTGKSKGFALFVYKTVEAARASLVDPNKIIDGHHMFCKFANEGKKGKPMGVGGVQSTVVQKVEEVKAERAAAGIPSQSSMPWYQPQYAGGPMGVTGPGMHGVPPYGAFPSHQGPPGMVHHQPHHLNSSMHSSIGASGLSAAGSHVPPTLGGSGGYGSVFGSAYGGGGAPTSAGSYGPASGGSYGDPTSAGSYGGPTSTGLYSGLGSASLFKLPPSSAGMPSGGYHESVGGGGAHYSLSSSESSVFSGQHHPGPRGPPGPMYPNLPSFF